MKAAWLSLLLLLPALASAAPRAKRRPEEDPRLGGAARAFAKARLVFRAPENRDEVERGDVTVRLALTGYALVGGAHAHLIVDNHPALQIDDLSQPLTLSGLPTGPHLLRAVLCRPWHEVVKAPRAFAMVRFWSGPRFAGRAGRIAEQRIWPHPRRPLLTYVLPVGEPPRDAPRLELKYTAPSSTASSDSTPTTTSMVSTNPTATSISPHARGKRLHGPAIDFYLSGTKLGRRGAKVLVVLDRAELPLLRAWEPRRLSRLRSGRHRVMIDLLDRRGQKVQNALNRTDRTFHLP